MSTRLVVVDDTNSNITYAGTWSQDRGSKDSLGTYGAPYQSTLHGTTTNSSLSFTFNGISVDVIGTVEIANNSGVIDPQWECFIDGSKIPTYAPSTTPTNHWTLCGLTFAAGSHVLTVNATVKAQTFWFDSIQYTASPGASTTNQAVLIDERDAQFRAGLPSDVWQFTSGVGYVTQVTNGEFTFNFSGSSLEYYGFIPDNFPRVDATATWAIDDGTPQEFALKAVPSGTPLHRFEKLFQTGVYPIGDHTLRVVYQGDTTKTPLTLTNVIVANGTTQTSTATTPSGSSTGASPMNTSADSGTTPSKSPNLGAILGGVFGGLAFFLVVALLFWLRRRRRRHSEPHEKLNTAIVQPFETTSPPTSSVNPTVVAATSPFITLTNTKGQLSAAPPSESDLGRTAGVTSPHAAGTETNPSIPVSSPALASNPTESGDPRVIVLHADSGIRLSQAIPPHARVEEVPPTYSA